MTDTASTTTTPEAATFSALLSLLQGAQRSVLNPSPSMSFQIVQGTRDRTKIPDYPPALIEGIVRERGKFLIAGASKSWKSFLAIELAVAVAAGDRWLGFECRQGKVLYVNLEIDDSQFRNRVAEMADAKNTDNDLLEKNLSIVLRSKEPYDASGLVEAILSKYGENQLDLVLIDPMYFLLRGSENEANVMREFCEQIDRLCKVIGCAVGVIHHHSKGMQGDRDVTDRSSGSSVLGRYFDAIVDVCRLTGNDNAMRAEFALRDYPEQSNVNYRFKHPLCVPDDKGELTQRGYVSSRGKAARKEDRRKDALKSVEDECERLIQDKEYIDRKEVVESLRMKKGTLSDLLQESERFKLESGANWCHISRRE